MKSPSPVKARKKGRRSDVAIAQARYMRMANCDSTTLGAPSKNNIYLRNRIEAAFYAGYSYAKHSTP